jgi:hypothetical protein
MAMSGNRPETVHQPDDLRTVSGHWQFGNPRGVHQCPETVRKPSTAPVHRTTSGRFPDIAISQVRKISGSGDRFRYTHPIGAEKHGAEQNGTEKNGAEKNGA